MVSGATFLRGAGTMRMLSGHDFESHIVWHMRK